ncbi:hypothetical protein [Desulfobacter vibrioformis]|uniref:hypothetical protein n=1 Tax=Desulfobacter vibrioformis TaxID=34031 RepID=UPI000555949C|nr:hypothetical protein [Desulfobacter vibrioformis]
MIKNRLVKIKTALANAWKTADEVARCKGVDRLHVPLFAPLILPAQVTGCSLWLDKPAATSVFALL